MVTFNMVADARQTAIDDVGIRAGETNKRGIGWRCAEVKQKSRGGGCHVAALLFLYPPRSLPPASSRY
jgi:hypothetical protein